MAVPGSLTEGGNAGAGGAGRLQEKEKWLEGQGGPQSAAQQRVRQEAGPAIMSTRRSGPSRGREPLGLGVLLGPGGEEMGSRLYSTS